jgi:uncharacterized protein (DUF1697 family)
VTFVALLRGINVGGKNKVDMKQLKAVFEDAGMTSVRTYINSGNVIFDTTERGRARLTQRLEKAIVRRFGFNVEVLLRDLKTMRVLVKEIPTGWTDDATIAAIRRRSVLVRASGGVGSSRSSSFCM